MSVNATKIISVLENYIQQKPPNETSDRRRKFLALLEGSEDVFSFANPVTICIELLVKCCQSYLDYLDQVQPANNLEGLCADELYKKLHAIKMEYEYIEVDDIDDDCEGEENAGGENIIDEDGKLLKNECDDPSFVPVAEKKQIVEKFAEHWGFRSLKWIQRHGGSKLLHLNYKSRWEEHVKNGGTLFEKYKAIDLTVWEMFREARQALRSVQGYDLRMWAIQAARQFPETPNFSFTASQSWIDGFKTRHKVSSRKINKLVKRSHLTAQPDYEVEIDQFRQEAKNLVESLGFENVINWDQPGCQYELVSARTLTHKGEPWTVCSARSPRNRVTHSYTIQYSMTASGQVLDQVFICLQESTGRLGPLVEESLPICPNILLTCSKSGKRTSLIDYFLDEQMIPHIQKNNKPLGFVVDHWGGQLNMASYTTRFGVSGIPECKILTVPKNCTPFCQPADTVFYRQVKYMLRRITQYSQLIDDTDMEPVHSRRNILLIHSLIHYQISAGIFQPMVRYAWFKAGILTDKESYLNVKQACFTFESPKCEMQNCRKSTFIRCARCRVHLCYDCFFHDYHSPMNGCVDVMGIYSCSQNSQQSILSMEEE